MKGLQFKLYTENINTDLTIGMAREEEIENFTVYNALGCDNGIMEESLIIESIVPKAHNYRIDRARASFYRLADSIKDVNKQRCVLITETEIDFNLY